MRLGLVMMMTGALAALGSQAMSLEQRRWLALGSLFGVAIMLAVNWAADADTESKRSKR